MKKVWWLGSSRHDLAAFPEDIRGKLGYLIYVLQVGLTPSKSRPMKSIGPGVFELKAQDHLNWYRVIYLIRVNDTVCILHAFTKQSAKTPARDLKIAKARLKMIGGLE